MTDPATLAAEIEAHHHEQAECSWVDGVQTPYVPLGYCNFCDSVGLGDSKWPCAPIRAARLLRESEAFMREAYEREEARALGKPMANGEYPHLGVCSALRSAPLAGYGCVCDAPLKEANAKLRESAEREDAQQGELQRAARCEHCNAKVATCFGTSEGGPISLACDECCGHGNEDGWCKPFAQVSDELQRALREREELRTTIAELRRVALHVADELWRETSLSLKGDGGAIAMIEAAAASAGADSLASAYARGFEAAREQAAKACEQRCAAWQLDSRAGPFAIEADNCAAAIRALPTPKEG